jgi:hypothetical protein
LVKVQRWWCNQCQKSFTPQTQRSFLQSYDFSFKAKAADLYYSIEGSYRSVAQQLGVTSNTAFKIINELGRNCISFVEVAQELQPQWSGFLLVDAKTIHVRKLKFALLLSADAGTQDIPCADLFDKESLENYFLLLKSIRDGLSYPIKGITVDGDPALVRATKVTFPEQPMQLCVRHVDEYHRYYFKYLYEGPKDGVEKFLDIAHRLLYVKNHEQLEILLQEYNSYLDYFYEKELGREVENFESKFDHLWVHLDHPGMPRTSNIIEGIIRQLSRKIDRTDGFESADTAWNSLKLLIMKYRFHTFKCSRIKGHNGESPLSLARVKTEQINWVNFSQKKQQ